MKTIGLIGGMSWESSVTYYETINQEIMNRMGSLHSAKCILYSVDFDEIETYQRHGKWDKVSQILVLVARSLELAGADFIIICSNTVHKIACDIERNITIPLLHIADITAQKVQSDGLNSVGLLGTRYVMEQDFYISRLEDKGLRVIVPCEKDMEIVNNIIFKELCVGVTAKESKAELKRIIHNLVKEGAQGIILGCTEIGLLIQQADSDAPLYDTALIHAIGAVEYSIK